MRSRRVLVASRVAGLIPFLRGRPEDNGTAYKVMAFRIPKKESAAPDPDREKRKRMKKLESILFGRQPDKNIQILPGREGIRQRLSLRDKDLLSERRGPWRRRGMKKRHQVRRRRKMNLGRFSATLQIV